MRTIVVVLCLVGRAAADDSIQAAKHAYPASLVERPMTLPPLMFQPSITVD